MYLFNLKKVSKTGGEILGADMIYNYEQVLRQVRASVKYKTSNKKSKYCWSSYTNIAC